MTENNTCEHGANAHPNRTTTITAGLTYFLIGGGIGAALALLFAPKSGSEFRSDIADVTRKGYDATLETAKDLKGQSMRIADTLKDKADAAYDFAAAKMSSGREAVADVVA